MTGKLRIDLQILLPQVPDESDACVRRLIHDLESRDGIVQVHLRAGSDGTPTQLCVHHDPDVVPLARIREMVERAGAAISERYGHALWEVKWLLARPDPQGSGIPVGHPRGSGRPDARAFAPSPAARRFSSSVRRHGKAPSP